MKKQALEIKNKIKRHWLEIAVLNLRQDQTNIEAETKRIRKLIKAKQDLLNTICLEFKIEGVLDEK